MRTLVIKDERARHDPPDLIVLDLNLPSLDGFGVLTKLRQVQGPLRVIVLSAHGTSVT